MMTIIQDLKIEFNKYVETLNFTQAEINVELKTSIIELENLIIELENSIIELENSIIELENSRESLKSQTNQREDKDSKIKYRN